MKVLVLSTMKPFMQMNESSSFSQLVKSLQATRGVQAEGFRFPVLLDSAERVVDEMSIARRLRLSNVDRLITLDFPTYLVPWHDKVIWLFGQYDHAYDLLEVDPGVMDDRERQIASAIRTADASSFREAEGIFTVTSVVSQRLLRYHGVSSTVLRPPLDDPALFMNEVSDGYILATGAITCCGRYDLLIKSLRYSSVTKLVIAGPPDTPEVAAYLQHIVAEEDVSDRILLDLRNLSKIEMARLINRALAVACLSALEDVPNYCAMGALQAGKPVLATTDAKGVLDLVKDGETGLVVAPEPEALGAAMAALAGSPALSRRLGQAGQRAMDQEVPGWAAAVERLLA